MDQAEREITARTLDFAWRFLQGEEARLSKAKDKKEELNEIRELIRDCERKREIYKAPPRPVYVPSATPAVKLEWVSRATQARLDRQQKLNDLNAKLAADYNAGTTHMVLADRYQLGMSELVHLLRKLRKQGLLTRGNS